MSSPIRERRPTAHLAFTDIVYDVSEAAVLATEMFMEGASQGSGCLVDGYFGHDVGTRLAQLSILQGYYASPEGGERDTIVIQEASHMVLQLWDIKEEEV